jgi:hypothetical protein
MPDEVIAGPWHYGGSARALPLFSCRHVSCNLSQRDDFPKLVMPGQKREARFRARCPGHPRLKRRSSKKDVDGRDKPGHDETDHPFHDVIEHSKYSLHLSSSDA